MTHGHTGRLNGALVLYDMAGRIDRLKVTLDVLPDPGDGMVPITVFEQIGILAGIIGDVTTEIGRHLPAGVLAPQPTAQALSRALDPLGEAVTELGRLQSELVSRLPGHAPSGAPEDHLSDEVINGCLEAATEALGYTASQLREKSTQLAPRARTRTPAFRPVPARPSVRHTPLPPRPRPR